MEWRRALFGRGRPKSGGVADVRECIDRACRISHYRGTPLTRKCSPLGPFGRPMPRVLGGSLGGGHFHMGETPLYLETPSPAYSPHPARPLPETAPAHDQPPSLSLSTLETTQGQIDGFFSQLLFKCYLPEVASVGDSLKICPWVASRVGRVVFFLPPAILLLPLLLFRAASSSSLLLQA